MGVLLQKLSTLGTFAGTWSAHDKDDLWLWFDETFISEDSLNSVENTINGTLGRDRSEHISAHHVLELVKDW